MTPDGSSLVGSRSDEQTESDQPAVAGPAAVPSGAVSGPSYSTFLKILATVIVVGACCLLLALWNDAGTSFPAGLAGVLLGALLVLFAGWWDVLTSRTSIDERAIRQVGLWRREVSFANITACQLVHVRSVEWLIAPRLIVRSGGYGVKTFYVSDKVVLEAIKELIKPHST